jgi:hypothetical protein
MIRPHADLFDVRVPIDRVDEHVADGRASGVERDPTAASRRVAGKPPDRGRLVVCDLGQADIVEPLAREAFDLSKGGAVFGRSGADGARARGVFL